MSEINYVVDKLEVKFEGIFNLDDFYSVIKEFLEQLKYTVTEKTFEEKGKESFTVKWRSTKPIDEYTQFVIKSSLKCDVQSIEIKNKKLYQGSMTFTLKALLERDYQELWVGPVRTFMRGIYDKFIAGAKFDKLEAELKDETYSLAEKARHYLNMKKFK